MRLGPLDISLRRALATVQAPAGELGVDGDTWLAKFLGGGPDSNPQLTGAAKFEFYDEMALSDSMCRALLAMLELPIVGAIWDFDPASSQPIDRVVNEACRWQFGLGGYEGQLDQSWKRSLRQLLLKNRYGAMFEEVVWGDEVVTFAPKDDAASSRPIRPIARLAPRPPRTVKMVDFTDGQVSKLTQLLPNTQPIPGGRDARKVCYYVREPRPGRWDGTSLLRAAWGPWQLKTELMIAAGIAWDRWASGIPVIRYPENGGASEVEKAEDMGRSVRNHERGYLAFQGPPPSDLQPNGWDIDIKGGPSNLPDPTAMLQHYDLAILTAGLVQWMGIAIATKTGARATAQVQDEPYYMAIEADAEDVALERQRQAVRYFVDVNFGTQYDTPRLTVSKIQSEDVAQLAQTLANLKLAGLDFSDIPTQDDIRQRMHLPQVTDDSAFQANEGDGLPPKPKPGVDDQQTLPV